MLICHAAGVARNGQRLCSKLLSSKGGRRVLRRIFNPQSDGEQFLLGGLPLAFLITPLEWKHQSSDGNCDANLWEKPFPLNTEALLLFFFSRVCSSSLLSSPLSFVSTLVTETADLAYSMGEIRFGERVSLSLSFSGLLEFGDPSFFKREVCIYIYIYTRFPTLVPDDGQPCSGRKVINGEDEAWP